ncbi:MAG: transposon-encoded TnpW family protein [Clostridiales bacterium]|nr:transposon-encoded TnpW family protein [Clostridiales bacterium]
MNTTDTINDNLPSADNMRPQITKKIGNTTYEVFVHFSKTSKETLTDKIMRLIRNDINSKDML